MQTECPYGCSNRTLTLASFIALVLQLYLGRSPSLIPRMSLLTIPMQSNQSYYPKAHSNHHIQEILFSLAPIKMKQDDIQPPRVTSGPGYPEAFAAQLETELSALRELIARQSSDGHLFDKRVAVDTPGLGEGHVKCSVCLPKAPGPTPGFPAPLPLIILLEGGGFALGQPSDGKANARFMSDKVSPVSGYGS